MTPGEKILLILVVYLLLREALHRWWKRVR